MNCIFCSINLSSNKYGDYDYCHCCRCNASFWSTNNNLEGYSLNISDCYIDVDYENNSTKIFKKHCVLTFPFVMEIDLDTIVAKIEKLMLFI